MWIRIRSWHEVRTPTRVPNTYITLCGRQASGETRDVFPGDEKTCESCYRVATRRQTT